MFQRWYWYIVNLEQCINFVKTKSVCKYSTRYSNDCFLETLNLHCVKYGFYAYTGSYAYAISIS